MNQSTPRRDTRKAVTTERKVVKLSFQAHGFLMKTVTHGSRTGTLRKLALPPEDRVESPSSQLSDCLSVVQAGDWLGQFLVFALFLFLLSVLPPASFQLSWRGKQLFLLSILGVLSGRDAWPRTGHQNCASG